MTVKQLYEWALENNCTEAEISLQDRDGDWSNDISIEDYEEEYAIYLESNNID